jgi:hypothetical protein
MKPFEVLGIRSKFFSITLAYDVNKSLIGVSDQLRDHDLGYVWDDAWKHYGLDFTFGPGPVTFSYRAGFYHDAHGEKGWMGYFPLIPPFVSQSGHHPLVFNSWGFEIRFYYVRVGFADNTWVSYPQPNLGNFLFSFSLVSPVRL